MRQILSPILLLLLCASWASAQTTFDTGTSRRLAPVTFNGLGTPVRGEIRTCSNCSIAGDGSCADGGTGAIAEADGSVWKCRAYGGGGGGGGGAGLWGSITGTLSNQTDLQTELNARQPLDSDLTAIAALAPSNNDTLMRIAGVWTNRTVAQAKTTFGLDNVDNTSDANKPVSTATQTALNLKANLASPVFSGQPTIPDFTLAGHTHQNGAGGGQLNASSTFSAGTVPLNRGGTSASLADPNADRIMFWDDSAGVIDWLTVGSGLSIAGTTISATGGGTGDVTAAANFGTDNVLIRSDGTTKGVQSSGVVIDDSNNVTIPGSVTSGSGVTTGGSIVLGNASGDTAASFYEANSGDGASNAEPAYLKLWSSHSTKRKAALFPCTDTDGVFCIGTTTPAADSTSFILTTTNTTCSDAGANDTYTCALAPVIASYVTGTHYRFKANTANTGAATINLNSLGAKTIKKAAGGITTDLADNDIRAGQWVELIYDGTNMQMQSTLGNAAGGGGGTPGGSDTQFQFNNASAFGGANVYRVDANTMRMRNGANNQILEVANTDDAAGNYNRVLIGVDPSSGVAGVFLDRAGTGGSGNMRIGPLYDATLQLSVGGSFKWSVYDNSSGNHFVPASDGALQIGVAGLGVKQVIIDGTNTAGGTTGAQTIDKALGTVNFAAAATSIVVTNSLVTTASLVFTTMRSADTTCTFVKSVVPAAGSFTITVNAGCAAETSVGFLVINQ